MRDRLLEKMHKKYGCDYCNQYTSLYRDESFKGAILEVYLELDGSLAITTPGYDVDTHVNIPIKHCPMCGKNLSANPTSTDWVVIK